MWTDFCNFAPSTSQGLVVEGKEEILPKKKSFCPWSKCTALVSSQTSISRRVREFLYISLISACTNQQEIQSIVVVGETSFDCYCIPLLKVCFQVLRNVCTPEVFALFTCHSLAG